MGLPLVTTAEDGKSPVEGWGFFWPVADCPQLGVKQGEQTFNEEPESSLNGIARFTG